MSGFLTKDFVKEFAYRTMINYYNFKNMDVSKSPILEVEEIHEKMRQNEFDVSPKYEVTSAINSMIGLLVFPEQAAYKKADADNEINFDKLPNLYECINTDSFYNSYIDIYSNKFSIVICKEKNIPVEVLKHLRNAVAHERIMIEPLSKDGKNITHIKFEDEKTKKLDCEKKLIVKLDTYPHMEKKKKNKKEYYLYNCKFQLLIPVEKLEGVLMEIANYLIDKASK